MRHLILAFALLLTPVMAAHGSVSVSIGLNLGVFPELVPVPGYPVYYDPRIDGNYFFYDGLYWVYDRDGWYSSDWYNGPWRFVAPMYVPVFILRVPVRYYRRPPPYFRGWHDDDSPRWGEHWGRSWEERRHGWDRWDRHAAPRPAPLPLYQREYSGDRYPRAIEQQRSIRNDRYPYRPHEPSSRQQWQGQERSDRPPGAGSNRPREDERSDPARRHEQGSPRGDRPQERRQSESAPSYRQDSPRQGGQDGQRRERQPQERPQRQMQEPPPPREQRAAPPPREPARQQERPQERGHEPRSEPRSEPHRPDRQ